MTTIPTPEEGARSLLKIFVTRFSCRAGHVLQFSGLHMAFLDLHFHAQDFPPAVNYATTQGWIEVLHNGGSYRLTDAGFSEA